MPNEWWKNEVLAPMLGTKPHSAIPVQQSQSVSHQPSPGIGGKYGYTGKGPDNIAQPNRRVPHAGNGQYDAHEAEYIFDANTTQAIGPDILEGVRNAAQRGTLDVNVLRKAIGQNAKPGYKSGGTHRTDYGETNKAVVNTPSFGVSNSNSNSNSTTDSTNKSTSDYQNETLSGLSNLSKGESDLFDMQRRRLEGGIGGAGAAATAAIKQEAAQRGVGASNIAAMDLMRQRDVESQTARSLADQAIYEQETAIGAMKDLGTEAREVETHEATMQDREKSDSKEKFLTAVEFGDDATVRSAYEEYFGKPMDASASVEDIRNYARKMREQGIEAGDIDIETSRKNLEALEQSLGASAFSQIQSMVDSGVTWGEDGSAFDINGDGVPDIKKEDWNRMRQDFEYRNEKQWQDIRSGDISIENAEYALNRVKDDDNWSDIYNHLDGMLLQNPNYVSSGEWQDDTATDLYLSRLWESQRMPGEYNPVYFNNGDPANESAQWATNIMKVNSLSQVDASINAYKNTSFYRDLSTEAKEQYDNQVFPALQSIAMFDGVNIEFDDAGELNLRGADGKVFWPPEASEVTEEDDAIMSVQDVLEGVGIDASPSQVSMYLAENGGAIPENWTATDYVKWENEVGSIDNVNDFLNGEIDTLSDKDAKLLLKIRKDQLKPESVGVENRRFASLAPEANTYTVPKNDTHKTSVRDFKPGGGMGTLHERTWYDFDIQETQHNGNNPRSIVFKQDFLNTIQPGGILEYNGISYMIDPENMIADNVTVSSETIKSGNDSYTYKVKAQGLNVYDIRTGKKMVLTFGAKGNAWD